MASKNRVEERPEFHQGIEHFNQGAYDDAHEAWEEIWQEMFGDEKGFMQGLIQLAVALHHHGHGKEEVARRMLERARGHMRAFPEGCFGIHGFRLADQIAAYVEGRREKPPAITLMRGA